MKISIFGMGYVGVVSGACLAQQGHEVIGVDVNPGKVDMIRSGVSPIVEEGIGDLVRKVVSSRMFDATCDPEEAVVRSDASLVSVGTPSAPNGSLSTQALETVTAQIGLALRRKRGRHTVVYRSTVLPGTTEALLIPALEESSGFTAANGIDVCFNPEFLREGSSIRDFLSPPMTVIGSQTESGRRVVEQIYQGLDAEVVPTTIRIAEAVKYLCNMYHAIKIVFANEVGIVLKQLGVDAREAMKIFCKDRQLNISSAYLRPGYAFGGSCLPKDLRAFLYLAKTLDLDLPMLEQVLPSNQKHIDRAYSAIAKHGRKRIALFGLAFKEGTDDLRESPIVGLAERLLGRGFELAIYDANVVLSRLTGANRRFIEEEIPHLDRLMCNAPGDALIGAEAVVVANADESAVDAIIAAGPGMPVYDLQGVSRIAEIEGGDYTGICW